MLYKKYIFAQHKKYGNCKSIYPCIIKNKDKQAYWNSGKTRTVSKIDNMNDKTTGEIILYQPDDTIRLEVKIENETVWLTQAQMVELFERDRTVITKHINNVFKEGELDEKSNVHFLHIAFSDKPVKYYNLDVIISVGYRVKSIRGTAFRRWATKTLREYILKGYVINQRISQLEHKIEKFELLLRASQYNESHLKYEIDQLKQYVEAVLADYNNINEDTRMQLELMNEILAGLQVKNRALDKPRNPIGFKRSNE